MVRNAPRRGTHEAWVSPTAGFRWWQYDRLWPMSDMTVRDSGVRFWGQSGHPLRPAKCLLMTQCGPQPDRAVCRFAPATQLQSDTLKCLWENGGSQWKT
jgi:hypothetical protein